MKILILTPWFPVDENSSKYRYIYDSAESLRQEGHKIVILHTKAFSFKNNVVKRSIRDKFDYFCCNYISIPRYFLPLLTHRHYHMRVFPLVKKLNSKYKFDIIHAHNELPGSVALKAKQLLNIPAIMTLHGISTEEKLYKGRLKYYFYDQTFSGLDRIIYVGSPLKTFFEKLNLNQSNCTTIPNGIHLLKDHETKEDKWHNMPLNIISVANLEEGKGIDFTLKALARLKNNGVVNWNYQIIGVGNERNKLQNLAKQLNINDQIYFSGSYSKDEVYSALSKAHIFVLPSYREAFGIAYLEAMCCGLLTIGIQGQGPSEFIENGKTGFLVSPRSVESIVSVLSLIINDFNKMSKIAAAGQAYVTSNYTWECHAKKLLDVYCGIVNENIKI